jgi:hypothetical protein
MKTYNGHGSTQSFAQGDIFPREDIPDLSNDQRLPAMVMMTRPLGWSRSRGRLRLGVRF